MSEAARSLIAQAMNLPPQERLRVARQLLSSVIEDEDQDEDEEWEQAWLVELDQRLAQMEADEEPALSWEQVQQRLRSLVPR